MPYRRVPSQKNLILVAEQLVWCGYDIYLASTKLITERNTIVDTRASWRERDENISHLVSIQVSKTLVAFQVSERRQCTWRRFYTSAKV